MKLYPHNYAEILAAVACTIGLIIKPSTTNRWFTGFLWLTVCVEFAGKFLSPYISSKMAMYNVFGIVECDFYLLYLSQINSLKKVKMLFKILAAAIVLVGLLDFLFLETVRIYSATVGTTNSLFILFSCLVTLYVFLGVKSKGTLLSVHLLILFSILIFYTGNFFVDALFNSLFSKNNPHFFKQLYYIVNGYLNVLMYSFFTLAFVTEALSKPPQVLSRSSI